MSERICDGGDVVELEGAGSYRCRNCVNLTEDGAPVCDLYGPLKVYTGPFATGDAMRHEDCWKAEDAYREFVKR